MDSLKSLIKIPSDKKFLGNKNLSDLLFGYLIIHSNRISKTKSEVKRTKNNIIQSLGISYTTYNKKILALSQNGYIRINGKSIIMSNSYKYSCVIPRETLEILLQSNYNNIIKVFVILNIFYENRKDSWFTYTSLLAQIGFYSTSDTRNNKKIKDILDYLSAYGLLEYKTEYYEPLNCRRFKIISISKYIKKEGETKC